MQSSVLTTLQEGLCLGVAETLERDTTTHDAAQAWVKGLTAMAELMAVAGTTQGLAAPEPGQAPLWLQWANAWAHLRNTQKPDREPELWDAVVVQLPESWAPVLQGLPQGLPVAALPLVWWVHHGADPAAQGPWTQHAYRSVLEWAMRSAPASVLTWLVEHPRQAPVKVWQEWPVNQEPGSKYSPKYQGLLGVALNSAAHTEVLLTHGVPVDAPDANGNRPLWVVNEIDTLQVLVAHGADLTARDAQGCRVRHMPHAESLWRYRQPGLALLDTLEARQAQGLEVAPEALHETKVDALVELLLRWDAAPEPRLQALLEEAWANPSAWTRTDEQGHDWGLLGCVARKMDDSVRPNRALGLLLKATTPQAFWRHESIPGVADAWWTYWAALGPNDRSTHKPLNKELQTALQRTLIELYPTPEAFAQGQLAALEAFVRRPHRAQDQLGFLRPVHRTMNRLNVHDTPKGDLNGATKEPWWLALSPSDQARWREVTRQEWLPRKAQQNTQLLPTFMDTVIETQMSEVARHQGLDAAVKAWWPLVALWGVKETELAAKSFGWPVTMHRCIEQGWPVQEAAMTPEVWVQFNQEPALHALAVAQQLDREMAAPAPTRKARL